MKSQYELLAHVLVDNFYHICGRLHDHSLYASSVIVLISLQVTKCAGKSEQRCVCVVRVSMINIQVELWFVYFLKCFVTKTSG